MIEFNFDEYFNENQIYNTNIISFTSNQEYGYGSNQDSFWNEGSSINNYQPQMPVLEEQEPNLNPENFNQMKNVDDPVNEKITNEEKNEDKKAVASTRPTSDKKGESQIKKKIEFKTERDELEELPKYWRFDMAKKHWKSRISNYATEIINRYIEESELEKGLKQNIHTPNSLLFTAKVTVTASFKFLKYTLFEVFTIGKETENLQNQNYENITKIMEYIEKAGVNNISDGLLKIKEFFEMSYEDLIRMFYDSFEFLEFKNRKLTKFYDEGTIKQEKFSLIKDYGLITLFKMNNKRRKRD